MKTVDILGVHFHAVQKAEAVKIAMERIALGEKGYVVTPNPEIVYLTLDDQPFRNLINGAALVLPDGIGVIYASRILGQPLPQKVAGIEFAEDLVAQMALHNKRLFLLGAKPGIAEQAGKNLASKYPGLVIAGFMDGYFSDEREAVKAINDAGGADVVFACLGAPKQEKFMSQHLSDINATLFCGLGGSLDVFAGSAQRAPKIFINLGLEWFYRLLKDPRRIGRMMKLPLFMLIVLKERILGNRKGI